MNLKLKLAAAIAAVFAAGAVAQPVPGPGAPPAEALATIPDLTTAQQDDLRRILIQRRDALEAAEDKIHADMEALHKRARSEHERIDEQYAAQLRKALGDDGYRKYAGWQAAHHAPPGGPHLRFEHGFHGGPGDAPPPPPPGAPAGNAPGA